MEEKIRTSLNLSIIKIRVELQNSGLKKSGKNKFAGFDYYELKDFLPKLNELMEQEKVNDRFSIKDNVAKLELIKGDEKQEYEMPFVLFDTPLVFKKDKDGNFIKNSNGEYIQVPSMQDIQYLGALNTYYKRYLYLNAFGITDGEVIDSMDNSNLKPQTSKTKGTQTKVTFATDKQKEMIKGLYSEEEIRQELISHKKSKLSDLTVKEASDLISKKKVEEK